MWLVPSVTILSCIAVEHVIYHSVLTNQKDKGSLINYDNPNTLCACFSGGETMDREIFDDVDPVLY